MIRVLLTVDFDQGREDARGFKTKTDAPRAETTIELTGDASHNLDTLGSALSPTASKTAAEIGSSSRPDCCFFPAPTDGCFGEDARGSKTKTKAPTDGCFGEEGGL